MPKRTESLAPAQSPSSAAHQVARFRAGLDWMLAHPLWEESLACISQELGFKGQRQGISQRSALRSLPLEQKQALLRHALQRELPTPSHAEAKRLARLWGATRYQGRSDFGRPSNPEWQALQQAVLIRICARYEQYKESQSQLFCQFQNLASEGARAHCSAPSLAEDACQEARLALLEAIDRIEPSENFAAYACQWIKRRVRNFAMEQRLPVKAPLNLISQSFRGQPGANPILEKAIREGTLQLDSPTPSAGELDPNLASEPESSPQQVAMRSDEGDQLRQALSKLTAKQREVVDSRFGLGDSPHCQSLAQIAQRAGISRQQIFQREKRALLALRSHLAELESERSLEPAGSRGY